MHSALVIAGKDLRQRLRDRSALALGLVAPLLVAALMSFAFKGIESFHYTLALADADHGPVAAGLARTLEGPDLSSILTVRHASSAGAAATAVREGRAQAALVVPAGFSASVTTSRPLALRTLSSPDNAIAGSTTAAIASSFVAQLNADRLSIATARAAGAPASPAELGAAAATLELPTTMAALPVGGTALTTISYYAPAMAIFFLLFTVTFTARSFFVDKDTGMVDRIRVAPVRPAAILLGKAISAFVFAAASLGVIAVITSAAFGADWGPVLPATALGLATCLAVAGLSALVIVAARSERQAEGIGSVVVFGLALVGGSFVLLSAMPPVMRRLALLTPNGWAMRGFTDLATLGGGPSTVAVPVAVVLGFAVGFGALAALLAPRALRR